MNGNKWTANEKSALYGMLGAVVFIFAFVPDVPQVVIKVNIYMILGTFFFIVSFLVQLEHRIKRTIKRL